MANREIELASPLLEEVVSWLTSRRMFRSPESGTGLTGYSFPDGTIPFRLTETTELHEHVDINNEDSAILELNELLGQAASAYRTIHQFGPAEFENYYLEQIEALRVAIVEDQVVENLGNALYACSPLRSADDREETLDSVGSMVISHLVSVLYARCASLSKRHAPTEAIFCAYKQGLFPWGWDWESLWCLDAAKLLGDGD